MKALAAVLTLSAAILLTDALRTTIQAMWARWLVILLLIVIILYIHREGFDGSGGFEFVGANINGR
jgi:hypothetical protein